MADLIEVPGFPEALIEDNNYFLLEFFQAQSPSGQTWGELIAANNTLTRDEKQKLIDRISSASEEGKPEEKQLAPVPIEGNDGIFEGLRQLTNNQCPVDAATNLAKLVYVERRILNGHNAYLPNILDDIWHNRRSDGVASPPGPKEAIVSATAAELQRYMDAILNHEKNRDEADAMAPVADSIEGVLRWLRLSNDNKRNLIYGENQRQYLLGLAEVNGLEELMKLLEGPLDAPGANRAAIVQIRNQIRTTLAQLPTHEEIAGNAAITQLFEINQAMDANAVDAVLDLIGIDRGAGNVVAVISDRKYAQFLNLLEKSASALKAVFDNQTVRTKVIEWLAGDLNRDMPGLPQVTEFFAKIADLGEPRLVAKVQEKFQTILFPGANAVIGRSALNQAGVVPGLVAEAKAYNQYQTILAALPQRDQPGTLDEAIKLRLASVHPQVIAQLKTTPLPDEKDAVANLVANLKTALLTGNNQNAARLAFSNNGLIAAVIPDPQIIQNDAQAKELCGLAQYEAVLNAFPRGELLNHGIRPLIEGARDKIVQHLGDHPIADIPAAAVKVKNTLLQTATTTSDAVRAAFASGVDGAGIIGDVNDLGVADVQTNAQILLLAGMARYEALMASPALDDKADDGVLNIAIKNRLHNGYVHVAMHLMQHPLVPNVETAVNNLKIALRTPAALNAEAIRDAFAPPPPATGIFIDRNNVPELGDDNALAELLGIIRFEKLISDANLTAAAAPPLDTINAALLEVFKNPAVRQTITTCLGTRPIANIDTAIGAIKTVLQNPASSIADIRNAFAGADGIITDNVAHMHPAAALNALTDGMITALAGKTRFALLLGVLDPGAAPPEGVINEAIKNHLLTIRPSVEAHLGANPIINMDAVITNLKNSLRNPANRTAAQIRDAFHMGGLIAAVADLGADDNAITHIAGVARFADLILPANLNAGAAPPEGKINAALLDLLNDPAVKPAMIAALGTNPPNGGMVAAIDLIKNAVRDFTKTPAEVLATFHTAANALISGAGAHKDNAIAALASPAFTAFLGNARFAVLISHPSLNDALPPDGQLNAVIKYLLTQQVQARAAVVAHLGANPIANINNAIATLKTNLAKPRGGAPNILSNAQNAFVPFTGGTGNTVVTGANQADALRGLARYKEMIDALNNPPVAGSFDESIKQQLLLAFTGTPRFLQGQVRPNDTVALKEAIAQAATVADARGAFANIWTEAGNEGADLVVPDDATLREMRSRARFERLDVILPNNVLNNAIKARLRAVEVPVRAQLMLNPEDVDLINQLKSDLVEAKDIGEFRQAFVDAELIDAGHVGELIDDIAFKAIHGIARWDDLQNNLLGANTIINQAIKVCLARDPGGNGIRARLIAEPDSLKRDNIILLIDQLANAPDRPTAQNYFRDAKLITEGNQAALIPTEDNFKTIKGSARYDILTRAGGGLAGPDPWNTFIREQLVGARDAVMIQLGTPPAAPDLAAISKLKEELAIATTQVQAQEAFVRAGFIADAQKGLLVNAAAFAQLGPMRYQAVLDALLPAPAYSLNNWIRVCLNGAEVPGHHVSNHLSQHPLANTQEAIKTLKIALVNLDPRLSRRNDPTETVKACFVRNGLIDAANANHLDLRGSADQLIGMARYEHLIEKLKESGFAFLVDELEKDLIKPHLINHLSAHHDKMPSMGEKMAALRAALVNIDPAPAANLPAIKAALTAFLENLVGAPAPVLAAMMPDPPGAVPAQLIGDVRIAQIISQLNDENLNGFANQLKNPVVHDALRAYLERHVLPPNLRQKIADLKGEMAHSIANRGVVEGSVTRFLTELVGAAIDAATIMPHMVPPAPVGDANVRALIAEARVATVLTAVRKAGMQEWLALLEKQKPELSAYLATHRVPNELDTKIADFRAAFSASTPISLANAQIASGGFLALIAADTALAAMPLANKMVSTAAQAKALMAGARYAEIVQALQKAGMGEVAENILSKEKVREALTAHFEEEELPNNLTARINALREACAKLPLPHHIGTGSEPARKAVQKFLDGMVEDAGRTAQEAVQPGQIAPVEILAANARYAKVVDALRQAGMDEVAAALDAVKTDMVDFFKNENIPVDLSQRIIDLRDAFAMPAPGPANEGRDVMEMFLNDMVGDAAAAAQQVIPARLNPELIGSARYAQLFDELQKAGLEEIVTASRRDMVQHLAHVDMAALAPDFATRLADLKNVFLQPAAPAPNVANQAIQDFLNELVENPAASAELVINSGATPADVRAATAASQRLHNQARFGVAAAHLSGGKGTLDDEILTRLRIPEIKAIITAHFAGQSPEFIRGKLENFKRILLEGPSFTAQEARDAFVQANLLTRAQVIHLGTDAELKPLAYAAECAASFKKIKHLGLRKLLERIPDFPKLTPQVLKDFNTVLFPNGRRNNFADMRAIRTALYNLNLDMLQPGWIDNYFCDRAGNISPLARTIPEIGNVPDDATAFNEESRRMVKISGIKSSATLRRLLEDFGVAPDAAIVSALNDDLRSATLTLNGLRMILQNRLPGGPQKEFLLQSMTDDMYERIFLEAASRSLIEAVVPVYERGKPTRFEHISRAEFDEKIADLEKDFELLKHSAALVNGGKTIPVLTDEVKAEIEKIGKGDLFQRRDLESLEALRLDKTQTSELLTEMYEQLDQARKLQETWLRFKDRLGGRTMSDNQIRAILAATVKRGDIYKSRADIVIDFRKLIDDQMGRLEAGIKNRIKFIALLEKRKHQVEQRVVRLEQPGALKPSTFSTVRFKINASEKCEEINGPPVYNQFKDKKMDDIIHTLRPDAASSGSMNITLRGNVRNPVATLTTSYAAEGELESGEQYLHYSAKTGMIYTERESGFDIMVTPKKGQQKEADVELARALRSHLTKAIVSTDGSESIEVGMVTLGGSGDRYADHDRYVTLCAILGKDHVENASHFDLYNYYMTPKKGLLGNSQRKATEAEAEAYLERDIQAKKAELARNPSRRVLDLASLGIVPEATEKMKAMREKQAKVIEKVNGDLTEVRVYKRR